MSSSSSFLSWLLIISVVVLVARVVLIAIIHAALLMLQTILSELALNVGISIIAFGDFL